MLLSVTEHLRAVPEQSVGLYHSSPNGKIMETEIWEKGKGLFI